MSYTYNGEREPKFSAATCLEHTILNDQTSAFTVLLSYKAVFRNIFTQCFCQKDFRDHAFPQKWHV